VLECPVWSSYWAPSGSNRARDWLVFALKPKLTRPNWYQPVTGQLVYGYITSFNWLQLQPVNIINNNCLQLVIYVYNTLLPTKYSTFNTELVVDDQQQGNCSGNEVACGWNAALHHFEWGSSNARLPCWCPTPAWLHLSWGWHDELYWVVIQWTHVG
jgi:hypothetical protein